MLQWAGLTQCRTFGAADNVVHVTIVNRCVLKCPDARSAATTKSEYDSMVALSIEVHNLSSTRS